MRCPRCGVRTINSQHEEVEDFGHYIVVRAVTTRECPVCLVVIKVVVPKNLSKVHLLEE